MVSLLGHVRMLQETAVMIFTHSSYATCSCTNFSTRTLRPRSIVCLDYRKNWRWCIEACKQFVLNLPLHCFSHQQYLFRWLTQLIVPLLLIAIQRFACWVQWPSITITSTTTTSSVRRWTLIGFRTRAGGRWVIYLGFDGDILTYTQNV